MDSTVLAPFGRWSLRPEIKGDAIAPGIALHNILFACDFGSCAKAATPYAAAIAQLYGAKLFVVHVSPPDAHLLDSTEDRQQWMRRKHDRDLDLAILEEQLRPLPHELLNPTGDASEAILRVAREKAIDLAVLGTHGRTGVSRLVMGSTAETILRRISCPVLTLGPRTPQRGKAEIGFRKILFTTDFTESSLSALPFALSVTQQNQGQLTLLYVLEESMAGVVDLDAKSQFLVDRLKQLVSPEMSIWSQMQFAVEFGSAKDRILQFSRDQAVDLIILGVRGSRSAVGATTHMRNSICHHLMAHAVCPVVTVRG